MTPFAAVPHAVLDDPRLGKPEILSYLILARYADNRTGYCYPSVRTIGREARIGKSSVHRAIENLVRYGWIRAERQYESGRKEHAVNRYWLLTECGRGVPPQVHLEVQRCPKGSTGVPREALGCPTTGTELDSRTRKRGVPPLGHLAAGDPSAVAAALQPHRDESLSRPLAELVAACKNGTLRELGKPPPVAAS